ncbi:MAG: formate acetyltransferase, partial [Clostridia bacterium]|nr:formate acetyltransferase [Clostridia bacterium]
RGAPITHGANPTPGFRKDGAVTAMATGIAAIQPGYGDPAPLQLEFDPRLSAEEGGIDRVAEVIKTHFRMGGTLININVLDKEVLMEAHRDPMSHPDLVVRVTGFTAYFCALSPEFRQLVIDRFIDGM